jgi:hypothetical protein
MRGLGGWKRLLAALLMRYVERRFRRRPDWAQAMAREGLEPLSDDERLRWSLGCAVAAYRASEGPEGAIYPPALAGGILAMAAYQWSADESLGTVAAICLIGLALGVLQPRRRAISGAAIGLVVAAVNSFETISGVRPAYEATAHSLVHDARWAVLIAPGLIASGIGGCIGKALRTSQGARG